jgi:RAB6A-GEF complex partner protein 1
LNIFNLIIFLRIFLAILFEDTIILGAENDTVLYTSDSSLHFSLPYCVLERTSQVYLHQILRQLIRRNLGYNAWEIARSCTNLPYFPHYLELLLHEVLEEEATSKEPIPDALLPSVLEFIQEFPVYLQTVVQCARKTEIALWPKELFQQCLSSKQLETAASYLIILQNLESSAISRQYATLLLDTALEQRKWNLAKELVRFLRAIDPNDVKSPRTSFAMGNKLGLSQQSPPNVSINAENLSLILGSMARGRSFSTTMNPKSTEMQSSSTSTATPTTSIKDSRSTSLDPTTILRRKKSMPHTQKEKDSSTAEEFFIDVILQWHAWRLLQDKKLEDLGYMSAELDFNLVRWLANGKKSCCTYWRFCISIKTIAWWFIDWPKPSLDLKLERRGSEKYTATHHHNHHNQQQQQESPSYSLQSLRVDTNLGTNDSNYTSLPPFPSVADQLQSIVLENFPLQIVHNKNVISGAGLTWHDIPSDTEAKLSPIPDTVSVASEQVSIWGENIGNSIILTQEIDQSFNKAMENLALQQNSKKVSHKLEVKLHYLLEIFTEARARASCLEFSLLISMLLMDAASICQYVV